MLLARSALAALLAFVSFVALAHAADTRWYPATDADGNRIWLDDARKPALYTSTYGDCLGSDAIDVTRFDAAYYKDNMTVLFHLAGSTRLAREAIMMDISVFAYGEKRFELTFDPCNANIRSLCPMNRSVPFQAEAIIPISQSDVAGIPPIALSIPDFEAQVILRIISNSSRTEIGCFAAAFTNGATFSQPAAVGTILGIFTAVALLASFATATYGDDIPTMRTHYAHSPSVFVVFAIFQHIFFTGALSVNWPSVLPAFWSNYAWSGGMIFSASMQNSIDSSVKGHYGNTSFLGAASVGSNQNSLGGGFDPRRIYGRALGMFPRDLARDERVVRAGLADGMLFRRDVANITEGSRWHGSRASPGLPLPGNYSGFAGTLAQEGIAASNAFLTGFLWLLILVLMVTAAIFLLKSILEIFAKYSLIRQTRLLYFRKHWLGYTALALCRTLFAGFFLMMFLTMFQFTYGGSGGIMALAALVFVVYFVGMSCVAGYAYYYRIRFGGDVSMPQPFKAEPKKLIRFIPWYASRAPGATREEHDTTKNRTSLSSWGLLHVTEGQNRLPSLQEDYIKKFGWLSARFRETRWWFFAVWILYEFIRACFLAGAIGHPLTQVFGLLVVEIIAFIAFVILKPFEGQRLNVLLVYLLGFSKVITLALSAAFDVRFNVARITTTAIGIVIIVIQGILTIILLLAIAVGAISSYVSVTRNREDFRPKKMIPLREKYLRRLNPTARDEPSTATALPDELAPEVPKGPYFSVNSVHRVSKIEDEHVSDAEDEDDGTSKNFSNLDGDAASYNTRRSRANSMHSQKSYSSLPHGARPYKPSWSTRPSEESLVDQRRPSSRKSKEDIVSLSPGGAVPPIPDIPNNLQSVVPAPQPRQNAEPLVSTSQVQMSYGLFDEPGGYDFAKDLRSA